MIKDRNIQYKYKTDFIPATSFNCFVIDGDPAALKSIVDATTILTAVDTDKYVGALTGAASDVIRLVGPLPGDWDFDNDMFFRVVYSHAPAATPVATFTVNLDTFDFGEVIATPATALSTPIAFDTASGSNKVDATVWGQLDGGTVGSTACWAVDVIHLEGGSAPVTIMGLEVAYLPKLTDGEQNKLTGNPTDA